MAAQAPIIDRGLPRRPIPNEEGTLPPLVRSPSPPVTLGSSPPAGLPQRGPRPEVLRGAPQKLAPGPNEAFDSIFTELEGLVRETLRESVEQTVEAARIVEPEMRAARPPMLQPEPQSPPQSRSPNGAQAPSSAARDLGAPTDEDEGDVEADAPAGPYNWGVRPAKRPPGAWLLGDEGAPAATQARLAAARAADPEQARQGTPLPAGGTEAPAARSNDAASAGAGAGGGRSYLQKKLSDEVRRVAPAMRALEAKGIVTAKELRDESDAASHDDGDDLCVDQFSDRAALDLEKELSPVRLVGELRRIRRLVDALLAKGVISQADLERADDE